MATRESLILTIRFPAFSATTVTTLPSTKPSFSRNNRVFSLLRDERIHRKVYLRLVFMENLLAAELPDRIIKHLAVKASYESWHVHTWKDVYETQEKKVCVSEAWDEDVYEDRDFCSYCGKDITDDTYHIFECGKKYYDEDIGEEIYEGSRAIIRPTKVDTIHHPAEYEIQKEKVLVGRKCSTCGAWQ